MAGDVFISFNDGIIDDIIDIINELINKIRNKFFGNLNIKIFSVNICDCFVIEIDWVKPIIVPNNNDDIVIIIDSNKNINITLILLIPIERNTANSYIFSIIFCLNDINDIKKHKNIVNTDINWKNNVNKCVVDDIVFNVFFVSDT